MRPENVERWSPLERGSSVAFIGLGRMGMAMARRLVDAGYAVTAYDVAPGARDQLLGHSSGSQIAQTASEACNGAAAVVLMLPDSHAVESVLEVDALLDELPGGFLIIDMGSSEPGETRRLAGQCARRNVRFVDAPVSGGVSGAESGTLTIMAGGDKGDVDAVRPLLDVLGSRTLHVGPTGAGHAVKALNNLLSATHLLATSEAMLVAREFGLELEPVLDAINISSGRSGSSEVKWPKFMLTETYDSGFSLRLMVKDMRIALGLAETTAVRAPLSASALSCWTEAAASLPPTADHTEIVRWLEKESPDRDSCFPDA
jgi:3-hydroxyisobutyrate dehydrogenase